ncbi:expressed unknown protein [Ectocarpus siliculosus]|uniref:Uncharacterized protein n=1 Tax=Ectocarpus siliculosus TaxID=2880 RepID=D7FLU1_ECTSI|nr:expressed unknown protein [Ectocarpus siliculosus]|eukprot:CBJ29777.1 expressed unknown protein [Ectocarpus siliculosus]
MALHFPRPPRLPKPPPPSDKAPLAGGGKSGSAGSSSSSSNHESQKQQQTATTPGGFLPQPAAGKSGRGTVASEGVTGVSDLDAIEGKDSAGHANDTRTDLNGSKAVVAKGDMELAEMSEMMSLVLERLSETERELKRIQKEGSLAKTNRSEVRDRKFIIDTRAKMLGAAFAGSVAGMIVGWSVLPNLWLVGGVTGALAFAALSRSSTGTVGTICSTCGIQVALMYKDVRDWWEQTVFLYKTGKLSYTYWRGFERYDQAWGLSAKYTETVAKVSKEALELDRQYKIRQKTLRAGKRLTRISRQVGSSAKREVTTLAGSASDWGGNKLRKWGLMGDDLDPRRKRTKLTEILKLKKSKVGGAKRPLGVSVVLDGMFGERSRSMYSAPPAGGTRIKTHKADPIIPARIRHMFMTKKQIRDERLQKYRVGFMGMRVPRSFDKDD